MSCGSLLPRSKNKLNKGWTPALGSFPCNPTYLRLHLLLPQHIEKVPWSWLEEAAPAPTRPEGAEQAVIFDPLPGSLEKWFGFQSDCLSLETSLTTSLGQGSLQWLNLKQQPCGWVLPPSRGREPRPLPSPPNVVGLLLAPWTSAHFACGIPRKEGWPPSEQYQMLAL